MANPRDNLIPFKKGDPRINRKGRPKSFDELRALAQQIAHTVARDGNGNPVVVNGHTATVIDAILWKMATSKDKRERELFVEYAFGKVPIDVAHKGDVNLNILLDVDDDKPDNND